MASTERADLLAIAKALKLRDNADEGSQIEQCDETELLRSIVKCVKSVQSGTHNETSNAALRNVKDSFAFPTTIMNNTGPNDDPNQATRLWTALSKLNDMLRQDYTCRRAMLLNRLDCTVESFKWKNSNNNKIDGSSKSINDLIHEKYEASRLNMKNEPRVDLANLLAVRETESDSLLNRVVSSKKLDCKISYKANERQKTGGDLTYLKQVVISDVPDRGGRTNEIQPPAKETFKQQRTDRGRGRFRR